jgi:hypothetical protein
MIGTSRAALGPAPGDRPRIRPQSHTGLVLAYDPVMLGPSGLSREFALRPLDRSIRRAALRPMHGWLLLAAVSVGACGGSGHSTSPDADGAAASATDGSLATPDGAFATPPGYVTVLVPNPDGPCALPTACGGDVTGTWVLVSECNRFPDNNWPAASSCDLTNVSVQATVWESKTLTISGGSVSGATQRLEGFVFVIPPTCLSSTPCSQWAGLLQRSVDAYSVTASCNVDSAGTCTCSEIAPDPTFSGSSVGTVQASDAGLSFVSSSGGSPSWPYCVSGSQLTFFQPDGDWVYTYRKQ